MPAIDFTEIPPANLGDGKQDTFELFARDFLTALGFEIEEGPSRGADGGKDLIILEHLSGVIRGAKRRWVVSCKHYAHSGKAVGDSDEIDVLGRVRKFKADGFMAFYSKVPSSGLMQTFKSHEDETVIEVWDNERIETALISDPRLQVVFERYFPKSYKAWRSKNKAPTQVFGSYTPLECVVCGKDLLIDRQGNVSLAFNARENSKLILDVYWACNTRDCDWVMEQKVWKELGAITKWESLEDLSIPLIYMRWIGVHLTQIREGNETYTDQAFEHLRFFMMCISQIIVKETAPEQWSRLRDLTSIPDFIGGIGQ